MKSLKVHTKKRVNVYTGRRSNPKELCSYLGIFKRPDVLKWDLRLFVSDRLTFVLSLSWILPLNVSMNAFAFIHTFLFMLFHCVSCASAVVVNIVFLVFSY
ncbi:hypothetical protein DFH05DRAFT_1470264 [Lentinula detonsa]|uniref:Transmembrane protein n=1 Tax=Lentinula detonsa TaxID=2804962 RepID=A0A9W8PC69_9AGAR|nr:hypothetical protein DFH05DRAFT_1470264 [Lentinula detonsa]